MRFAGLLILVVGFCTVVQRGAAQTNTEKELVQEIVSILQANDDSAYGKLFPNMEVMNEAIAAFQPKDSFQLSRINRLKGNIHHLAQFDPEQTPRIYDMMNFVRKKGADSGVHWGDILIAKYELDKQRLPPELIGFELIAPLRMQGFIFIRDVLTRRRYAIAVRDIFLINDKWYGGLTLNILEASSAVEYEEELMIEERELRKLMLAKEAGVLDSIMAVRDSIRKKQQSAFSDEEDEEEAESMVKDIADRKLYTGFFDKTVEVELYIRYIKGGCPSGICAWEAMYRFGDTKDFILLDVERKPDGTFVFTESDLGIMELKLHGDTFTGNWISNKDKTEYETYLKEKQEVRDRKLYKLDTTYEEIRWK